MQVATDEASKQMIEDMMHNSHMKKQARLRAEREPKINHVLENRCEGSVIVPCCGVLRGICLYAERHALFVPVPWSIECLQTLL